MSPSTDPRHVEAAFPMLKLDVPVTGDAQVDAILAHTEPANSLVSDSGVEEQLAARVFALGQAHRELQARLSTDRA